MRSRTTQLMLVFVIPVTLSLGCSTAPSKPLSLENMNSIKRVHVDKNVPKPETILWRGSVQGWSAVLFGALGAAATAEAAKTDADLMVLFMEKERIDISELVYSEALRQLKTMRIFELADIDAADATMRFSVDMYGFNKTHPFGRNMNPLIRITGILTRPNNVKVWQAAEFVSDFALENDQGQSLDTYLKEPAKLRAALAKATEVCIKRILTKLQSGSG